MKMKTHMAMVDAKRTKIALNFIKTDRCNLYYSDDTLGKGTDVVTSGKNEFEYEAAKTGDYTSSVNVYTVLNGTIVDVRSKSAPKPVQPKPVTNPAQEVTRLRAENAELKVELRKAKEAISNPAKQEIANSFK